MKLVLKIMLGATMAMMLPTFAPAKEARELEVSEATVNKKCEGKMQSNGGVKGCTVACPQGINGTTCDYSCGGPGGKGCRVIIFSRTSAPAPKKGQVDPASTVKQ
ncbi:hypothetical protein G7076_06390 [Sphingomonas sp. HDW15A]|uniref:hypothetical protein n=1 Tax=Sphingomonas sp. HDW15A TaxID=2714942 RepID=UPI0014097091|nr:hypothetical protein [Sphingomonas sp. HDW15A]QIK96126.1 hypothetical protein G7076_06390 [Sphingomonas sp. HDW15A]